MFVFSLLIIHSWCVHITLLASVTYQMQYVMHVVHRNLIQLHSDLTSHYRIGSLKTKAAGMVLETLSLLSSFEMEVCFETLFGRKMFNKDFIKYLFRIPEGRNFFRTSSMFRRHMRGRWKSIWMKSCRIIAIAIIAVLEKDPRESKVLERCIYQHQK